MMQAVWHDKVIAQSDHTKRVEGNHYFPIEDVDESFLVDSPTKTLCFWKGMARYRSVAVGDDIAPDAAWFYPKPSPLAKKIKGHIAFAPTIDVRKV